MFLFQSIYAHLRLSSDRYVGAGAVNRRNFHACAVHSRYSSGLLNQGGWLPCTEPVLFLYGHAHRRPILQCALKPEGASTHYPFERPVSTAPAYGCCFGQPSGRTVKNSARSRGPSGRGRRAIQVSRAVPEFKTWRNIWRCTRRAGWEENDRRKSRYWQQLPFAFCIRPDVAANHRLAGWETGFVEMRVVSATPWSESWNAMTKQSIIRCFVWTKTASTDAI